MLKHSDQGGCHTRVNILTLHWHVSNGAGCKFYNLLHIFLHSGQLKSSVKYDKIINNLQKPKLHIEFNTGHVLFIPLPHKTILAS